MSLIQEIKTETLNCPLAMKEHMGLGWGRAEREDLLRATYIKCHILNMLETGL